MISNIEDIKKLIENAAEESTELEYKRSFAEDKKVRRGDIAKDVSAMANANGGIIIYGIAQKENEEGHAVPKEITPIPSSCMSKDQLAQIISSNISPHIKDIEISFIPYNNKGGLFVVQIPKSSTAHQNLTTRLYHIRRNATIEIMEDYEIRDVMSRQTNPPLSIDGCAFYKTGNNGNQSEYEFYASIRNDGYSFCNVYKLNVYFNKFEHCNISWNSYRMGISYTPISTSRLKISCNSVEPIFEQELLGMGHFKVLIDNEFEGTVLKGLVIDMVLFYPGGKCELAYIPEKNRFIQDRDEIKKVLEDKDKVDEEFNITASPHNFDVV